MLTNSGFQQTLKIFEKNLPSNHIWVSLITRIIRRKVNPRWSEASWPKSFRCFRLLHYALMSRCTCRCTFRCTLDKIECTLDIEWMNFSIKLDKSGYESGAWGRDTEVVWGYLREIERANPGHSPNPLLPPPHRHPLTFTSLSLTDTHTPLHFRPLLPKLTRWSRGNNWIFWWTVSLFIALDGRLITRNDVLSISRTQILLFRAGRVI